MKKLSKKDRAAIDKQLTVAEQAMLLGAMWRLWQYIGSDAEQACEQGGERLTNECAAEFVLDAQRLEMGIEYNELNMQPEEQKLFSAALKKFRALDWNQQTKFLLDQHTFA